MQRIAGLKGEGQPDQAAAEPYRQQFSQALGNDLNTSQGLTVLYDVLKSGLTDATKRYLVEDFDTVLDLDLLEAAEKAMRPQGAQVAPELAEKIEGLIAKRAEARKAKDWAAADAIRDELAAMGVVMKDTANGVEWVRDRTGQFAHGALRRRGLLEPAAWKARAWARGRQGKCCQLFQKLRVWGGTQGLTRQEAQGRPPLDLTRLK